MGAQITANELLQAVADTGYFEGPGERQALFCQTVEYRLNVSVQRAIELLTQSGLATFSYRRVPGVHLRDVPDSWQLELTTAGSSALSSKL